MKNTTNKLTEWAINKIKTEYPDDIALLIAVDGASINGDGHGEPFGYFIPSTERGNELAQTFIIDGVGNDLYPRSWERTERTANLDDLATPCLGNAEVLYARSKEDEKRFEVIRKSLFENLADPVFVYKKALENLDIAMDFYKTMMFEERLYRARGLVGYIYHHLTVSVACLNNTYRKDWHNGFIKVLSQWNAIPDRFVEYYQAILAANTVGELKSLAHLVIASSRQFISRYKPENSEKAKTLDYNRLAEWYQEIRTWWNRLYYFCDIKDSDAAFRESCQLQSELDIVGTEFGLGEMDLLGCFDTQNLEYLFCCALELEKVIVSVIESNGVIIKDYNTIEEFLAAEK